MPIGAATWSFTEDDFGAITITLQRFLYDAKAKGLSVDFHVVADVVVTPYPSDHRAVVATFDLK
jgi:hypothetical protein